MSFRSGFVAIAGIPNAGKSTLLNALAGEKISIISRKPQTTRNAIKAVVTDKNWQIVFIDTPGLHTPRTKLGTYMMNAVRESLEGMDIVLYLAEAGRTVVKEDEVKCLKSIKESKTKCILVVTKTDYYSKQDILKTIETYSRYMNAETAVPVSAIAGSNLDILLSEIVKLLPEGPKYYPDDTLTDQMEKTIAAEMIREKALLLLQEEVPHGIGVIIEKFSTRPDTGIIDISAVLICDKESHKAIIIGRSGAMLKKIGSMSRIDMEKLFGNKIYLKLWVKVREGWRNNIHILREMGYSS